MTDNAVLSRRHRHRQTYGAVFIWGLVLTILGGIIVLAAIAESVVLSYQGYVPASAAWFVEFLVFCIPLIVGVVLLLVVRRRNRR